MSTSDSDYSLDWLASDEDDCDSPKRSSPQRTEDPPVPPQSPSPSSSSSREPPPDHLLSSSTQRRRRRTGGSCDCKDGGGSPAPLQTAAVSPLQGLTSVYTQQTPPPSRKRAHGVDGLREKPRADAENEKFSHKCTELQCYIQPLSSILRGLRSGRYSERLSSFQESVAMDRIQRIMGVLQNPNMGGRFLCIVLKIEEMLHSWFPHIKPDLSRTDGGTPAKKQKQCLSSASLLPSSPDVESALAASDSSTRLKWLHTSPICSLKAPESSPGRPSSSSSAAVSSSSPPSREVTQDNAVSSSSDSRSTAPRRLSRGPPPPFKISSPCLERLLQAKESIIAPRTVGGGGWLS